MDDQTKNNIFALLVDLSQQKLLESPRFINFSSQEKARALEAILEQLISKISSEIISVFNDHEIGILREMEKEPNCSQLIHGFLCEKIPNFDLIVQNNIDDLIKNECPNPN